MTVSSISPASIRSATTADSSRSARNFGKIRPFETAPSSWPARPIRWRPRATDFGLSTWMTRSTAPMSIPSSSEEVAIRQGISPRFSSSSTSTRCSRASEPWWARAISLAFSRQLVQPQREPLGQPAVVDEDDRGAVLLDQPQQLGVDRRPDRGGRDSLGARAEQRVGLDQPAPGSRMSSTGTTTRRSSSLRVPASTSRIGRAPDTKRPISSSGRWVAERPIALDRVADQAVQTLDRQRQVCAALRPCDRVHLVEDQRADGAEHLAALRGEQQEQRLGRGDQDVGRLAQHRRPLLLRRVAGADGDGQLRLEARERAAQVPLDVVVQGLQRRDVEEA